MCESVRDRPVAPKEKHLEQKSTARDCPGLHKRWQKLSKVSGLVL